MSAVTERLSECLVCGTYVMHNSKNGITCGDSRCEDRLTERVHELLVVRNERNDLKRELSNAEYLIETLEKENKLITGKFDEIKAIISKK